MNRRNFIFDVALSAAALAAPAALIAQDQSISAALSLDDNSSGATMPLNFTGLSYETAQLGNPKFFSAENKQLIEYVRALGPQGVLRLGGGTSEFTQWVEEANDAPPPFDSFGPDTSKRAKTSITIGPDAIRNLREFLDATGWQLLYGLKVARGTPEEAAREAAFVQQTIGPRLLAFQIGNEPDAWRNRYFPASWGYTDYFLLWKKFHSAIVKQVPHARFAGPDVSNHMEWVTQFAEQAKDEIILLTGHYYAEGPASSPNATLDRLLQPNPRLVKDLATVMQASRAAHIPYRMSEGNSCWDGGKPGVSDTLASALWAADMMLQFAQAGSAGVNLHGGGNGYYTPIAGGLHDGLTKRPEYYGMQFTNFFAGWTFLPSTLQCMSDRVTAYVARKGSAHQWTIINKSTQDVHVGGAFLKSHHRRIAQGWYLNGPSFESKDEVVLKEITADSFSRYRTFVPAHSAVLLRFQS
ncbi:MAG: hypothetical protein ACYC46_09385 [Acidobacteriaceae bacterium]